MSSRSKIKMIKREVEAIFKQSKTNDDVYSHVSMGGTVYAGKFNFTEVQFKNLIKLISKGIKYNFYLPIAEIPREYGPIKVDLDLKIPEEDMVDERLYSDEMIENIISVYRNMIKKYLKVTDNDLKCILFEKSEPTPKNGEIKDGFHLIFPNLSVEEKVRYLICDEVIKHFEDEGTFQHLIEPQPIDRAVVSQNPWLMYGCAKPGRTPYYITKIYDANNNLIDIETLGKQNSMIKTLSLNNKLYSKKYATPLIDGIDADMVRTMFDGTVQPKKENHFDNIMPEDDDNIIRATKLVDMLSYKRAHNYHDWIRVGWALHNTHKALLNTWITFSKRSKKFKHGECEKEWEGMKDGGLTIRSLMAWAKEDSPKEYNTYMSDEFNFMIKKNTPNNTFGVAKALYNSYQDKFVCISTGGGMGDWFHFNNHRWENCPGGGLLIPLMSGEFANKYIKASTDMNEQATLESGGDKKTLLDDADVYRKIASKLQDIGFKERVMKEAKYLFYDKEFMRRLDENPNLIGFENGVYDLEKGEFRPGRPDDHISMSTRVDYIPWSDKNPYKKHIDAFFQKVLVNDNVRNYFLKVLSTTVCGFNREEKFYFCTGVGSNGKSLTFTLLSKALGDYYLPCPITILTRKRNASNAASPEILKMKGPRGGVFQEPGMDEELNIGIFKELTGNDEIQCRDLYKGSKDMIIFKPQLTPFMACNDMLEIKGQDNGTWRRVVKIDFASEFLDNPDPNDPLQFKIDETLKEKIDAWAKPFASYLIHIYMNDYLTSGKLIEPDEVKVSTNMYRKDQDIFSEYYDNCIEKTPNKNDIIQKRDLFANFKIWFRDVHDGEPLPKGKKLYEFIEKELKQNYKTKGYVNIKFKNNILDDSESEDDMSVNPLDT